MLAEITRITDALTRVAERFRKPGYMSSDVIFAQLLDPIIADLEAIERQLAAAGLVPPLCATCQGRGWVMKSTFQDHGNGFGSGSMGNEPCPDCALPSSPLRSPKET